MRQRRIENEWRLLEELAALNPASLKDLGRGLGPNGEFFRLRLSESPSPIETASGIELRDSHAIEFHFRRFFPAVPIEAVLADPVFHPNVDPENGFVCLWFHFSPGDRVAEALVRLQLVLAWELLNLTPNHLMQAAAAEWYQEPSRSISLPCAFVPLSLPAPLDYMTTLRHTSPDRRQRLSLPSLK